MRSNAEHRYAMLRNDMYWYARFWAAQLFVALRIRAWHGKAKAIVKSIATKLKASYRQPNIQIRPSYKQHEVAIGLQDLTGNDLELRDLGSDVFEFP